MKKDISFELFITVLGRGIWQVIQSIVNFLGFKKESRLGKWLGSIILFCLAIFCIMGVIGCIIGLTDELRNRFGWFSSDDSSEFYQRSLGKHYTYFYDPYQEKAGYVIDNRTGKKVLTDILTIEEPLEVNSLSIYQDKKGKMGYLNPLTAEIEIDAIYDKAWDFSSDLAAVKKDGEVFFIDPSGYQVINATFIDPFTETGYRFYGNYCAVNNEDGHMGIIDRTGYWVIEPKYVSIERQDDKYWRIDDEKYTGVMTDSLTYILPLEYTFVVFSDGEEPGIFANKDGVRKLYDFDGSVKNEFVIQSIGRLSYLSDQADEDGRPRNVDTDYFWYSIDYDRYGLMDKNGKPLTRAIYSDVNAVDKNLFQCLLMDEHSILVDQNGKVIN